MPFSSKPWTPLSVEVYQSWVEAIETEASDKLTSWESDFVADISILLERNRALSKSQAEVLERIYAEKIK